MKKILFVCTGNICRSPTAEGVLRHLAKAQGLAIEVDSAGTHAYHVGEAPDPRSIRTAAAAGYNIASLRARKVSLADFHDFDLILGLDAGHHAYLLAMCPPDLRHKVALFLSHVGHEEDEVPDPYYGSQSGFDLTLRLVEEGCALLLSTISRS